MLPTPSTSHVSFATVYEPAEDSFLLIDTLSSPAESAWLHARFSPSSQTSPPTPGRSRGTAPLLLEVGSGSGVVVAFLTTHARRVFGVDVLALGTDVNGNACRATGETVARARADAVATSTSTATSGALDAASGPGSGSGPVSIYLSSINADLTSPLLAGLVDVLVFNPPYVPTETLPALPTSPSPPASDPQDPKHDPFAAASHLLSLSYAGGAAGMQTTQRLLDGLPAVLSVRGVAYVLLCAGNRPEVVKAAIRGWEIGDERGRGGWRAETVGRSGKTGGWEKLEIVRIWRDISMDLEEDGAE